MFEKRTKTVNEGYFDAGLRGGNDFYRGGRNVVKNAGHLGRSFGDTRNHAPDFFACIGLSYWNMAGFGTENG